VTVKASRALTATLVSSALGASLLAGCSSTPSEASADAPTVTSAEAAALKYDGPEADLPKEYKVTKPGKPFTIGYQILNPDPGLSAQANTAKKETEAMGGRFISMQDNANASTQVNNCNTLIAQGVDAIIVYPADAKALQPCFDAAAKQNIQVVAQQTPVKATAAPLPSPLKTDVLQGFDYAAYLRTQAVAVKHPGSTFAYMGLAVPVASLDYAKERMLYWAKRFGLKYVGGVDAQGVAAGDGAEAMSSILGKYPDVGTVFNFSSDPWALAAAKVAAAGNSKVRIVTYNFTGPDRDAVKKGGFFATIAVDVETQGKNLVDAAIGQIQGIELPKFTTIPIHLVTADNAGSIKSFG
jgi:ABC-type sugar transport system substrate-binding protein